MFLDLFYGLRDEGVPISMKEWMMFMEALREGLHGASLLRFYHLGRSCLVKSEVYFDAYDRVFAKVFEGVEGELDIEDEVLQWLRDPKNFEPASSWHGIRRNMGPEGQGGTAEEQESDWQRFCSRAASSPPD